MDWVETAPTPERTNGQDAPTAKAQVATATAKAPLAGSWVTMDQVMFSCQWSESTSGQFGEILFAELGGAASARLGAGFLLLPQLHPADLAGDCLRYTLFTREPENPLG